MAISKKIRQAVYEKYDGHCAYCGCKLELREMQVDHIKAQYVSECQGEKPDNSLDNLMPSCRQCNFYKQSYTIDSFRYHIQNTMFPNLQKGFQYRLALKMGLIEEKEWDGKFFFEKILENKK